MESKDRTALEQELFERIRRAFAGVPCPTTRVAPHHCPECDEIVKELQGRNWDSLKGQPVPGGNTDIPSLSPEAIHYYLPLILESALRFEEWLSFVMFFLSDDSDHTKSQTALLTLCQRNTVLSFLEFVKQNRINLVASRNLVEELDQAIGNWTPT